MRTIEEQAAYLIGYIRGVGEIDERLTRLTTAARRHVESLARGGRYGYSEASGAYHEALGWCGAEKDANLEVIARIRAAVTTFEDMVQ